MTNYNFRNIDNCIEFVKNKYSDYKQDVETIMSYNSTNLSNSKSYGYKKPDSELSSFFKTMDQIDEEKHYAFEDPKEEALHNISYNMHTIEYVKEKMEFWKGRSEDYINNYTVVTGTPQFRVQQQMANNALNSITEKINKFNENSQVQNTTTSDQTEDKKTVVNTNGGKMTKADALAAFGGKHENNPVVTTKQTQTNQNGFNGMIR